MDPNTTELTGLIKSEIDLLDYPRFNKDGECSHSSAINHVLVFDQLRRVTQHILITCLTFTQKK